jgi:hypothetical protein
MDFAAKVELLELPFRVETRDVFLFELLSASIYEGKCDKRYV